MFIKGLQNLESYNKLNPEGIESIENEENKVRKFIWKYKNSRYTYRSIIDSMIFSSNIKKKATVLSITCTSVTNAKGTIINGDRHKSLDAVNLDQMLNWKLFGAV